MKKEYEIKRELKRLASIRGTGTELISIYMPPGFPISEEIAKLRDEHSQATNIKSKSTKLNVQGALEKLMQYIKLFKTPPKNGIAIFCGNTSSDQAKTNIELFSIEPPQPIKSNIYRCDSDFLLEPIQAMLEAKESYALLVMDGREATIALLKGTDIIVDKQIRSLAHAKVRKGGSSAARYERAIGENINDYYKQVADTINALYFKHNFKIEGLIVGGPGPAKENFVKAKHLNYQIKVLGVFDTGYTDENEGVRELLEKAKEKLSEQEATKERVVMERFLNEVARNGPVTYGYDNVKKALEGGSVSKMIISEDAEIKVANYKCSSCGIEIRKVIESTNVDTLLKHEDGGILQLISQKDAIEDLIEIGDRMSTEMIFISSNSQYGKELLMGFKGVAAMLKYK